MRPPAGQGGLTALLHRGTLALASWVLLTLISFTPVPDPRIIGYDCFTWHRSIYGWPMVAVACEPYGTVTENGRTDLLYRVPDAPPGWFLIFCVRSRTCCDVSICVGGDARVTPA